MVTSSARTRCTDITPNVIRPRVEHAQEIENAQKDRGSGPAGSCATLVGDGRRLVEIGALAQQGQQDERRDARDREDGEASPEMTGDGSEAGDEQRPGERADLVERFVNGETAATSDRLGHAGQQRRLRRAADRLAGSLQDDQRTGDGQPRRAEERGDRQQRER